MTSVNSSMLSGLMSTMLNDWSVRSMFLYTTPNKGKHRHERRQKEEQHGVRNILYRGILFCQGSGFQFLSFSYHMLMRKSSADKYDSPSLFTDTLLMWYAWALEKIRRGTAVTALRLLCTVGTFKVYIFI